ncbi:cobyrinate a,c-diamide synthase [Actinoplanes sp. NEAU-A12]|uniref:Cobyrinate a,c-diamide synthase n=1 Tax=Actinoplanes sandaracinus TaxID=3045177 RepID=A0ABT6WQL7_9ACTN|nr:cobyrinate a,c-diamide synthase [Actinoplanes sandaracinus]MDI6102032.1 cobyrinate a,c-diamide synthase [Actinoplanes sandaracinus]
MSAPSSGHGKTAIAVGLLAALSGRGIPTAGFKVGPDHTDAAYLGLAAGRPGRNLDPRLVGAQRVAPLFAHGASGAQVAIIEGAMGLFDSLTGQPEIDGTASVAASLRAPVVLVVDVAAMGHSLAALVHGFRMFDEMVHLGGVILNRVASERHEQMLRSAMDDIGMPVLGALHRGDLPNVLPARTHGLVPVAHRTVEAGRAVRRLGEAVAGSLDMDRLMALASSAPPIPGPLWSPAEAAGDGPFDQRPVIALAGGQGAPYTYVETAELLTAAGADVAVVDPLRDEALPPGTRALVVGAGLPEGYAEELSANRRLCAAVAQFARDGWPVVAEGVALPWLGRELDGRPMCGVLDATATTAEQTVAGYREATAPGTSVLAPAGARITGYKQHRAVVTPRAGANPAWTWSGGNPEGFVWRQVHASQLGLHWAAAPEIARRLVAAAHAGPQGAPGAPGAMPMGMPSGPPMGMPSGPPGMPPSGHPGMPPQPVPVGPPMPPMQGSPAVPSMPPQGVPAGTPMGLLPGQGPMPAGPPPGMPPGQPRPGSGMPGQGVAGPGYGPPDSHFPGQDISGSGIAGYGPPDSGTAGRGLPGQGTPTSPSPGMPGHVISTGHGQISQHGVSQHGSGMPPAQDLPGGYDQDSGQGVSNGYEQSLGQGAPNGYEQSLGQGAPNGYEQSLGQGTSNSYEQGPGQGASGGYEHSLGQDASGGYEQGGSGRYERGLNHGASGGYERGSAQGASGDYDHGPGQGGPGSYDQGVSGGYDHGQDQGQSLGRSYDQGHGQGQGQGQGQGNGQGMPGSHSHGAQGGHGQPVTGSGQIPPPAQGAQAGHGPLPGPGSPVPPDSHTTDLPVHS